MRILGVETSFDDTGVAIYDSNDGLLINEVIQQCDIHVKYGGVVPELAAREHMKQLSPLIKNVLKKNASFFKKIDCVAYTAGPGLPGSLLVGATMSCALAYSYNIPSIPVHHLEGHILSPMLEGQILNFPFIALLVSGKHTQLIRAYSIGQYEILGSTLDDAVGEVFDKIAKLLNLGFPGGRLLSDFASHGKLGFFKFPKPMKYDNSLNFSFSGLKTFTLNLIKKNIENIQSLYNIACEFENTILDILVYKSKKALQKTGYNNLVVSGGVSANYKLIHALQSMLKKNNKKLFFVDPKFCTDNAAMIAYVGMLYLRNGIFQKKNDIFVRSKWLINDIY
ncbi:tRNA (adenosine(37)-N6)-threonylcarbamoyltransferase complex transferase subunit TsaD [Buchnera aphidicola]|uniref:tRNA (adenosine(37)-N6)-threonylcarbamoyltransferase complex transferase subunit TsaD n=1 Tax=Buchnera aphidicola TaxID=9 RepID=UPI0031B80EE8